MQRGYRRVRSLRRAACGLVAIASLIFPALRPTGASAYAGGGFKPIGSAVNTGVQLPASMVSGDFNGDGNSDVAIVDYPGDVAVLLSHPNGQLTVTRPLPQLTGDSRLVVGDFNNDGIPDLVVTGTSEPTNKTLVQLFAGDGSGGFSLAGTASFGQGGPGLPNFAAVGDVNGDGHEDLVVSSGYDQDFWVLLGDGTGHFTPTSGPY